MVQSVIIDAKNITKTVTTQEGELQILEPISLTINKGQSVAITGASGSGKSTLLGILAGLDIASKGQFTLAGNDMMAMDEEGRAKVRAQNIVFFQSFQLLPGSNALQNVMLPLELAGNKQAKALAQQYLDHVGLSHRINHYPQQLSGGEQQRVAIARAFASHPKILFADEPTGNLDSKSGAMIIDLLFDLNRKQGTTLILVTHESRLAERCKRQIEIEAGCIINDSALNSVADTEAVLSPEPLTRKTEVLYANA